MFILSRKKSNLCVCSTDRKGTQQQKTLHNEDPGTLRGKKPVAASVRVTTQLCSPSALGLGVLLVEMQTSMVSSHPTAVIRSTVKLHLIPLSFPPSLSPQVFREVVTFLLSTGRAESLFKSLGDRLARIESNALQKS
jgi:hypothetical protein